MFEDRGIIPKCFNGLDSKALRLYNINKKKSLIEGIVLLIYRYKMFMEMFIICQNLNTLLLCKNAFL